MQPETGMVEVDMEQFHELISVLFGILRLNRARQTQRVITLTRQLHNVRLESARDGGTTLACCRAANADFGFCSSGTMTGNCGLSIMRNLSEPTGSYMKLEFQIL